MNDNVITSNYNKLKEFGKISVVGAGKSGIAAVKLLHALNLDVVLHEKQFSEQANAKGGLKELLENSGIAWIEGEHTKKDFEECKLVIPSPGIAVSSLKPFLPNDVLIMSETELASLFCRDSKILAITGTSGKTTTTSLCSAMLEAEGFKVFTGGNIGNPLSEYVLENIINKINSSLKADIADVIVLELSSFQLQNCIYFHPNVAICLNITENHLDYHKDMNEYIEAKMKIFACQNSEDHAIIGESIRYLAEEYKINSKITVFDSELKRFSKIKLIGQHNQANAEAAWQACKLLGVTEESAKQAVAEFIPMPHRLEYIAGVNGVSYYNDSKCTTVDALKFSILAVKETNRPICLLAGGKFKGGNLAELIPIMQKSIKHIALYGQSKEIFSEAFGEFPISYDTTMEEAINRLQNIVVENDLVLLAPATSSFDQYQNFEARGNDFRKIVFSLK